MGLLDVVKFLQRLKGDKTEKVKKERAEIQVKKCWGMSKNFNGSIEWFSMKEINERKLL